MSGPIAEFELDEETLERFWSRVDKRGPDECWEWAGTRNGAGTPQIKIGGKDITASRVMLQLEGRKSPPPRVKQIRTCKNLKCMNPAHMVVAETWSEERARHALVGKRKRRMSLLEMARRVNALLIPVGGGRYLVEMERDL